MEEKNDEQKDQKNICRRTYFGIGSVSADRLRRRKWFGKPAGGGGGSQLLSLIHISTEIEYKHFKSVLEGGVEIQPDNVLVYVTSNRRNLVKETWTDRNSTDGEIFASDGIQEMCIRDSSESVYHKRYSSRYTGYDDERL